MADIIHVITDMGVGGAGVLLSRLLDTPSHLGSLVVLPRGSLLCLRLKEMGIPYLTYSAEGERSFSLSDVRALGKILKKTHPALLVTHASLSARLAAKRLGVPTLSVRHCDTPLSPLAVPLYNALTDATVATSRPLAAHLRQKGIKRIFTVENGYTDMGVPDAETRLFARNKFGFSKERVVVGLVGRLAPIKGHETAIRALALLGDQRSRFTLCFLGEGESEGKLRALSAALGLEKEVRFLGFSLDTRSFYHAIDAHISCSAGSETSSLSLAEGMSAGCPTFASDTEGNRARLGEGGRLFRARDAQALARHFLSLLDEDERESLSRLARARAEALPTWDETRRAYSSIFDVFRGKLVRNGCNFPKDMLQ